MPCGHPLTLSRSYDSENAGLIDETELEGMLSLVEARLRRLLFEPARVKFPSIKQMIAGQYLFSGDKDVISQVFMSKPQRSSITALEAALHYLTSFVQIMHKLCLCHSTQG